MVVKRWRKEEGGEVVKRGGGGAKMLREWDQSGKENGRLFRREGKRSLGSDEGTAAGLRDTGKGAGYG